MFVCVKDGRMLSNVPLPQQKSDSEDEGDISEQDIEFVKEHLGKLTFLEKIEKDELDQQVLQKQVADMADAQRKIEREDEEFDELDQKLSKRYKKSERKEKAEEKLNPLPIKTADGRIVLSEEMNSDAADLARRVDGVTVDDAFVEGIAHKRGRGFFEDDDLGSEPEDDKVTESEIVEGEASIESDENRSLALQADERQTEKTQEECSYEEMKTVIAVCANEMLVKSEKSVGPLRKLLSLCKHKDAQIVDIALLSCMKVFADIIPGYKIQPKASTQQKLIKKKSEKDELKRKEYESLLLRCYQSYLKVLLERSKMRSLSLKQLRVCIKCFCGLAANLHHFNYGTDLIRSVVSWMKSADPVILSECCHCASEILQKDLEGHHSLEIVQLVGDLIKKQKCKCDPRAVQCLFPLTFPNISLPTTEEKKIKKISKNKRRKMFKIRDELEKQGQDYDVHHQPYDKSLQGKSEIQTKTVEAFFEIFFRVLKHCSHQVHSRSKHESEASVHAYIQQKCPLLSISLEGLGKYAHLMSIEYFDDLFQLMTKLLNCEAFPFGQRFQCLLAIFCILKGQGEALNIDRKDFYQHLYNAIICWRPDSIHKNSQSTSQEGRLFIQVCHQMLCETKSSDFGRLAAFIKRLLSISLHQETGISIGVCAIVNKLLVKYRRLRVLVNGENEAPLAGNFYDGSVSDPCQAGGLLTALWELTILQKHFNPHISQGAQQLMKIREESLSNMAHLVHGIFASNEGPNGVAKMYSTLDGTFWPAPTLPFSRKKKKKRNCSELDEMDRGERVERDEEVEMAFKQLYENGIQRQKELFKFDF